MVKVYANSHYVTPKPTLEQAVRRIKEDLRLRLAAVITTVARLERQNQVRQWFGQAERELLELLRGEAADAFTVTITCAKGRWFVATRSTGVTGASAGTNTRGEGANFAEAWHDRSPLWS